MRKVLAVQLPAICPLHCAFCRTPQHGEGDMDAVRTAVKQHIDSHEEVYLTSNGETGFAKGFPEFAAELISQGKRVSVLCATERSIVPGLKRVEISVNKYTRPLSDRAVNKAKELGIPTVISMVDEGNGETDNLETIADRYQADGVLVRALQAEGRSLKNAGQTKVWMRDGVDLELFPVSAYRELEGIGAQATCINHLGKQVSFLGTPAYTKI